MIQPISGISKITALLVQHPDGPDRPARYLVFYGTPDGEKHMRVNDRDFAALQAKAGSPSYSEPCYWEYEDRCEQ